MTIDPIELAMFWNTKAADAEQRDNAYAATATALRLLAEECAAWRAEWSKRRASGPGSEVRESFARQDAKACTDAAGIALPRAGQWDGMKGD